jgi:competence protein ComEC
LITGARPPVVRAATLVVLYCMARGWNRSAYAWNALGAAGVVALAIRPAGLFDTGTQLSFLAVATLMAVWPLLRGTPPSTPLERLLAATRPLWLRCCWAVIGHAGRLLLVSAVVWLVSLPLVALRFHMIAPLGIALNVLLWLPLAAALLLALLTVISSPLPWIPGLCGLMCDTCLSLIELSTGQAARWSIAHVASAGAAGWWVTLFYVALAAWQFLPLPVPRRWWLALLGVWLTVAVAEGAAGRQLWHTAGRPPLRLSFIAVGHGTSVLVELPDGRVLLYDAGSMGRPSAAALPISSVLWARRVSHLDALVLSHADADHFNAVGQLLQRFSVGVVYVSPAMFQGQDPALQALRHAIRQAQVPLAHLTEGQLLQCGAGVRVEALHPPREDAPESGDRMPATGTGDGAPPVRDPGRSPRRSDNSQSIVLRIRCQALDCLLTGDLEGDGLDELLAEQPEPVGVLMAPHHGSLHSEPRRLVAWGAPQAVVISAGANVPRSVLDAYAAAGAAVFWTDRDGMIEVSSATTGIEIRSWRGERRWLPARP